MTPPAQTQKPTMRRVAELAGVSVAVVSYSFNHPERVADATRARVLQAAEDLGYNGPDPAARALRTGRSGMLALYPGDLSSGVSPFVAHVIAGVLSECQAQNLALVMSAPGFPPPCDGAVLLRPEAADVEVDQPHAWIGPPEPGVENLITHDTDAYSGALAKVHGFGHERIAFVTGPGFFPACQRLTEGYPGVATAVSAERDERDSAAKVVATLLKQTPLPTALVTMGEAMTFGARDALEAAGLGVPIDMSIVCAGHTPSLPRDVARVGIDVVKFGRAAVEHVVELIDGRSPEPMISLPANFEMGMTLGPARGL